MKIYKIAWRIILIFLCAYTYLISHHQEQNVSQQQILALLNKIQEERKMSILFISHDLGVVNEIADYIYVMKEGKIIEHGKKDQIFYNPQDTYTKQ